jgi:hypothetical protein
MLSRYQKTFWADGFYIPTKMVHYTWEKFIITQHTSPLRLSHWRLQYIQFTANLMRWFKTKKTRKLPTVVFSLAQDSFLFVDVACILDIVQSTLELNSGTDDCHETSSENVAEQWTQMYNGTRTHRIFPQDESPHNSCDPSDHGGGYANSVWCYKTQFEILLATVAPLFLYAIQVLLNIQ